jgi:hypothetical protein
MEANHVYRRHGKERLCGLRCFSLSAPSAREGFTLSVGLEVLPGFQAAVGRGRQDTAGLCAAGIRRLPEVRQARTRISTATVRELPRRTPGEKSGIKRIQLITREQGAAPKGIIRVADKIKV